MRSLLFSILVSMAVTAGAAVVRDPATGVWLGNICQTSMGWQEVPWQPIGTVCYSPGWRAYGFIANY